MNREIKFRAWDKRARKMIFVGFHVMGEVTAFNLIEQYIFENMEGARSSLDRWSDIEITQYTGMPDKNGVDIYEGDMFAQHGNKGSIPQPIRFIDGAFFVGDKRLYGTIAGFGEVVGNIYENQ